MKSESEITVQVFESLKSAQKKLDKQGFKMIEKFTLHDYYYSKFSQEETLKRDFLSLLNSSILFREVVSNKKRFYIMHKEKVLDENKNVISEQKTKVELKDLSIMKVFDKAGLNKWCDIKNTSYVYKKGKVQFCLQDVKGLGIFIEYERDDYINSLEGDDKFKIMCDIVNSLGLKLGKDFSCKKQFMMLHSND